MYNYGVRTIVNNQTVFAFPNLKIPINQMLTVNCFLDEVTNTKRII